MNQEEERKSQLLKFTPDGIPITPENKFDDGIYEFLYELWKETSGEYDPNDDVILEPEMKALHPRTKNEMKFELWALEQYGMTKGEERGYTLEGSIKSLWELEMAAEKVLFIKGLPALAKETALLGKNILNNDVDTSLGIVAGNGGRRQVQNTVEDAVENVVKKEATEETREKIGKETFEDVTESTVIKDSSEDLLQKTVNESVQGNFDKVKDNYLKRKGIDAHELKKDFLGKKAPIAQYDIYVNKDTGELFIFKKRGKGEGIPTGEFIK